MAQKLSTAQCVNCETSMYFIGTKKFLEGGSWTDWLGEWGTFLQNREKFDVFACNKCGKIDFYIAGSKEHYIPKD